MKRLLIELEKAEEKLFLLEKFARYFELVFPSFYFKLAIRKVIVYMSEKSDQKGHPPLIFRIERNEEGKVDLCSHSSGCYAGQLVHK